MRESLRGVRSLVFLTSLFVCVSSATADETQSLEKSVKPFQKVLFVIDGSAFGELHRQGIHLPLISAVSKKLSESGVLVTVMQIELKSPNAAQTIFANAAAVTATHVFVMAATVRSWGKRYEAVDPQKKLRMVSDYSYSLIVLDPQTRRKLWEAKVSRPESVDIGDAEETQMMGDKVFDALAHAGFVAGIKPVN